MTQSVSVIIPAYNEELGVSQVVASVKQLLVDEGFNAEVIVVDDGSTDSTSVQAAAAGARV